jgi:hypothetical protein
VGPVTEVRFGTYQSEMYYGKIFAEEGLAKMEGFGIGIDGYIDHIEENGSFVDVFVPVARQFDVGELTVYFGWSDAEKYFAAGDIIVEPYTFASGSHNGLAKVSIPKQYVLDGNKNAVKLYFLKDDAYYPIDPSEFDIDINYYFV